MHGGILNGNYLLLMLTNLCLFSRVSRNLDTLVLNRQLDSINLNFEEFTTPQRSVSKASNMALNKIFLYNSKFKNVSWKKELDVRQNTNYLEELRVPPTPAVGVDVFGEEQSSAVKLKVPPREVH